MNIRVPDLAVTCTPNEPRERAIPDPVLIIEMLSPSNEDETRRNVWAYASIPSVQEILLVRSTEIAGELIRRLPDGSWPERPERIAESADLTLESIGFAGSFSEFYDDTHLARPVNPD
jgi:Uma2 family endonuclease